MSRLKSRKAASFGNPTLSFYIAEVSRLGSKGGNSPNVPVDTLALLAGVNAAIEASEGPQAGRMLVGDGGRDTRLILCRGAGAIAAVMLAPRRAVALAAELVAAALPRFPA